MQIICKKRLHFQDHEIVHNEKLGEKVAILKQEIVVKPSNIPQNVPDWIKNDDLFHLSVDDGTITIVQVLSTPKGKAGKSTEVGKDDPTSGWGAKPGSALPSGNKIDVNKTS